MRNLEERKEEIFRRSQERIAQRKKTLRRVIVSCAPVVLCLGVMTGYLALMGFGKADSAAPEAAGSDYNYGMVADAESPETMLNRPESMPGSPQLAPHAPVALEIGSRNYTDDETLAAFQQMICVMQMENATAPDSTGGNNYGGSGVTKENIVEGDPYPVAVTYADGTVVWYTLRGNQLTRQDGEVQMLLTDEQAQWLHELLEGK